jgi:hypothetical protein
MPDEMDTKPTIDTVLERLGAFRNAVETGLGKIETDVSEIRKDLETSLGKIETDVSEMRKDVAAGFHKLDRRLEVLSGDIVKLRGDIGFIEDRFEKLDAKPS